MSLLRTAVRVHSARLVAPRLQTIRFKSTHTTPPPSPPPRPVAKEKEFNIQRDWDAKIISYRDFLPKTKSPAPNTYIIDVREPDEVIQGMIPSAVNVPLSVLPESLNMPFDQFREKFGFEKPQPDQEITFYCRSGMRSASACDIAKRNGYRNLLNFKGSWLRWTEEQVKQEQVKQKPDSE
ncbi:Rhodanese-like domain-containing protein [Rhodocollybia butyracea]|uniref:Rhodanese-like domain-containing protein n=1 Tax=Rhodocollybia butyracea TaxID=206335 RepID=A0A9P5Q2Y5_9AGAR|nr:Rhodanese-like domain-containing protein [Rhodocollybia butyracea]